MIMDTPLQLYISALIFSPHQSVIRHQNLSQFQPWIKTLPCAENDWISVLQTLEGHAKAVGFLRFSLDGQQLASASQDHMVRPWDAKTGVALRVLEGHSSPVVSIDFYSDSKKLASGDGSKVVRLWNPKTGALLQNFPIDWADSLVFSPTSSLLLALQMERCDSGGQRQERLCKLSKATLSTSILWPFHLQADSLFLAQVTRLYDYVI